MSPDSSADPFSPLKQTQQGTYSHRLSDGAAGGVHQRFRMGDEFFRQVVESLEDYAVFTTNVSGDVSSWNGASERLLGYAEGEMIGRPADLLFAGPDGRQGAFTGELRTARDSGPAVSERELLRRDGTAFWAFGKVFPLLDADGQLRGFTVILRDITVSRSTRLALTERETELQRLNEALAAASEEMHAAGEEVTASNEELVNANAQLSHLNGDLENFVYAASHDLKAPILNIEGLMQVLLKKLPAEYLERESVREITGLISDSVGRFKKTIGSLMEIAKLQQESDQPMTRVDLHRVVQEVQLDLAQQVAVAGANLEIHAAGCPSVRFAEKHLRSVVYNFISNAIKYASPERPPRVRVSCYPVGKFVVLSVEDNGLGMDLSKDQKLFTLFGRLHDHVEGSGIGLYMVKKIVQNAGGKVEVESSLDEGSTFRAFFRAG